jgi:hypothetical protein
MAATRSTETTVYDKHTVPHTEFLIVTAVHTSNSLIIVSVIVTILTELVPQFGQYSDGATGLVDWENGG